MSVIRTIVGLCLIGAGCIHWLILFGFLHEKAPLLLNVYFHSLAVLDIVAGVLILMNKRLGFVIVLCIALTQIPAHGYMYVLDVYQSYGSGIAPVERIVEIALSVILTCYSLYILRTHGYR